MEVLGLNPHSTPELRPSPSSHRHLKGSDFLGLWEECGLGEPPFGLPIHGKRGSQSKNTPYLAPLMPCPEARVKGSHGQRGQRGASERRVSLGHRGALRPSAGPRPPGPQRPRLRNGRGSRARCEYAPFLVQFWVKLVNGARGGRRRWLTVQ